MDRITAAVLAWFIFCGLLALGIVCLGAWAVIELVGWVIAQ